MISSSLHSVMPVDRNAVSSNALRFNNCGLKPRRTGVAALGAVFYGSCSMNPYAIKC